MRKRKLKTFHFIFHKIYGCGFSIKILVTLLKGNKETCQIADTFGSLKENFKNFLSAVNLHINDIGRLMYPHYRKHRLLSQMYRKNYRTSKGL